LHLHIILFQMNYSKTKTTTKKTIQTKINQHSNNLTLFCSRNITWSRNLSSRSTMITIGFKRRRRVFRTPFSTKNGKNASFRLKTVRLKKKGFLEV
jgi:hypothetical protein